MYIILKQSYSYYTKIYKQKHDQYISIVHSDYNYSMNNDSHLGISFSRYNNNILPPPLPFKRNTHLLAMGFWYTG